MLKLIRYLKRYMPFVLAGIVFLFGQAMLDLNLPNMMSNIVNTGIQKSGIEELAPRAISGEGFALLERFMTGEMRDTADAAYTPFEDLSASEQEKTLKTFPEAGEGTMVLTGAGESVDEAFTVAGYALVNYVQDLAEQMGREVAESDATSADFDLSQLAELMPYLAAAPQENIDAAITVAANTPETLRDSVAAVMNKGFYTQLGADTGRMQTSYIMRTGGTMLLIALCLALCAIGAGYCFARVGAGVGRDLRRDIYTKVTSMTNAEMDSFSTSSLITRTTNDVTQVQGIYTMGMRMIIFAPIMGIGGIIMALRKSTNISWIIALGVIVMLCIIGVLFVVVMPRFKKMQKLVDRLNLVSRENLTGIMVVRAFSNQKFQQERFRAANKDLTQNSLFVNRAIVLMMPLMMLTMNGISLLIIWFGAEQIAASAMQVGDMMAFIQYAMQIIMSFLFIAMIFVMVPRASVSAERINEVLTSEELVKDPEEPKTLGRRSSGNIRFNDVSFKYAGAEDDVLHHISFTAKPGQTTAFIGATGSGKSTLINLIPRFYDVTDGSITLDGVDIRDLTQHELRDNIGYVPQKGLLFTGDITSNLRYGDEGADDEVLRKAAEVAQATEFIDHLDNGFETEISQGGTNVSGGQRQRLSIARALVKQAPVYIFDDSFSALDFATDAKLRAALKPYTEKSTVLIVAQRVSTIMHAEQIVVLDEGRVAGIGTHEDLLKTCKTYREIAESQLSKEELA